MKAMLYLLIVANILLMMVGKLEQLKKKRLNHPVKEINEEVKNIPKEAV